MAVSPTYSGVSWTVVELLAELKKEAAIPDSASITNSELLAFADHAIRSLLSEPIVANLGFSGRALDFAETLATEGLRSYSEFLVPNAAASGTVSHVDYYENDSDTDPHHLNPTTAFEAHEYATESGTGTPTHWYFRDGRVVLVPRPASPAATAKVRVWFPRAHPKLVEATDNVAAVSSVNTTANTVTLAANPANWPSAPFAVDLYSSFSPHTQLLSRLVITANAAGVLTYTPPIVGEDDLDAADTNTLVALSGQCDRVQLPDSMRKSLTARAAAYYLQSIGDLEASKVEWEISEIDLRPVKNQLTPRAKGGGRVFINHSSRFRSGRAARRRRWWT